MAGELSRRARTLNLRLIFILAAAPSASFLTSVIQFQYSRPPPAYNEFLQMPFWFGVLPSPTAPLGWDIMYARQSLLLEDEKFDDLLSWNQFKPRRQSPDLLKYFTSHTLKLPQNVAGCPGGLEPGRRSQLAARMKGWEFELVQRCAPRERLSRLPDVSRMHLQQFHFQKYVNSRVFRHSNSQNK